MDTMLPVTLTKMCPRWGAAGRYDVRVGEKGNDVELLGDQWEVGSREGR